MKYYKLRGTVDQIPERYWIHLKRNEPLTVELTKEEYEDYRGFKQTGGSGADVKDAAEPVGENTAKEYVAQVSGESTKKEIVAEILAQGSNLSAGRLMQKNKHQLLEML